jgi:superfamily II DNA helicase RecQ
MAMAKMHGNQLFMAWLSPGQGEAVKYAAAGAPTGDVLVALRTGGSKSAVYTVPP